MTKIRLVFKGGPGSGHHGHQGRPGKRGGSLPGSSRKFTGGEQLHGTSVAAAKKIAQEGLKALPGNRLGFGDGRADSVYFTTSYSQAHAYGEGHGDDTYAVVSLNIPQEERGKIIFDDVDFQQFGQEQNWRMERDIPTEWIQDISLFDTESGRWVGRLQIDKEATERVYIAMRLLDDDEETS